MNKKDKRKLKHHILLNAYGDPKLARQGRDWGDDRFYRETGIKINNKSRVVPKIKKTTKRGKQRKQKYYNNYKEHIKSGRKPNEAHILRTSSKIQPKPVKKSKPVISDIVVDITNNERETTRESNWSIWSSKKEKEEFPPQYKKLAERFNLKEKLGKKASYGYAMLYFMYVREMSYKEAKKIVKADSNAIKHYVYHSEYKV